MVSVWGGPIVKCSAADWKKGFSMILGSGSGILAMKSRSPIMLDVRGCG